MYKKVIIDSALQSFLLFILIDYSFSLVFMNRPMLAWSIFGVFLIISIISFCIVLRKENTKNILKICLVEILICFGMGVLMLLNYWYLGIHLFPYWPYLTSGQGLVVLIWEGPYLILTILLRFLTVIVFVIKNFCIHLRQQRNNSDRKGKTREQAN